jgi:hypothetical protein
MNTYENFDNTEDNNVGITLIVTEKVFTKFCIFGMVYSSKWDNTFLVVLDGVVRIYDSEETYQSAPENFVEQYILDSSSVTSSVYFKDYSTNSSPCIIHYAYLLEDNGLWAPTKLIKFGSLDRVVVNRIVNCIKHSKRAV